MPRAKAGREAVPKSPATAPFDFEQTLAELEGLVGQLEHGDLTLEAALAAFERGVKLTRACQEALTRAEQKVELLTTAADGTQVAVPFSDAGDEPA